MCAGFVVFTCYGNSYNRVHRAYRDDLVCEDPSPFVCVSMIGFQAWPDIALFSRYESRFDFGGGLVLLGNVIGVALIFFYVGAAC